MSSLLLKGGIVLIHDQNDKVQPTHADVLVKGSRIAEIGPSLTAPSGCDVIDCTDKIISPGFVDTHHHVWQTPLKGLFGDMTFLSYMAMILTCPFSFHAPDMYWANLSGALEAIDAGTTTALDHAHCNYSEDHSKHAIAGSLASGIRSVFAYSPTLTMTAAQPKPAFADFVPSWCMPVLEKLARSKILTEPDARVRLGFGFDGYFLPKDMVVGLFEKVRSLGVKVVTSHYARPKGDQSESVPSVLKEYGLLERGIVLSHAGGATAEDAKLLREAGAYVSATPSTEVSMAVGPPVVFRDDLPGMDACCSFGIDSHGITSSSMVNDMRLGLQHARGLDSATNLRQRRLPREIHHTTHEAFTMGTLGGARALCMESEIGSIEVGKRADVVVFSALSPQMLGVAQQDPVMAVILHSSPGDIEEVIVDGVVRKRDGKLLPVESVEWDEGAGEFSATGEQVGWNQVAARVLDLQKRFLSEQSKHDMSQLEKTIGAMLHLV